MAQEITGQPDQPEATVIAQPSDQIDPKAFLHPHMRVLGVQGKLLGKIETLDRDTTTGQLSALVVRHGLFKNKLTSVPAGRVKWVNADSVILDLSPSAFKKFPPLVAS